MKSKGSKKSAPQDVTKKVFDVMRPGKTPSSATSRPVIVGHKPQVKDPMMSDRDDDRPLMDSTKKVTIQPDASTTTAVLPPTDPISNDTGPAAHGNPSSVLANAAATGSLPTASPASREPTRSSEALATQSAESESVGGSKEDRTRMPEGGSTEDAITDTSESKNPTDTSAAGSVATIATSSVVDDVPPPQEDTAQSKPVEPTTSANTTSGVVFDDFDGESDELTKPTRNSANVPVSGDTDGALAPDASREPTHSSEARATQPAESELVGDSEKTEPSMAGQAVVSHHKQSAGVGGVILAILLVVLLAVIAVDILFDMGILNLGNVPHTNFFPPN